MRIRLSPSVLALALVLASSPGAAQEPLDRAMTERMRQEGLERSRRRPSFTRCRTSSGRG